MDIKQEEYVFKSEVLEVLEQREDENLAHAQKIAEENLSRHTEIEDTETLEELRDELLDIDPVETKHAYRILEVMPEHPSTVEAIFSKERVRIEDEHVDSILSVLDR